MRTVLALLAVATAAIFSAPAQADDGEVPQETLAALGLGEIQTLSDSEGMAIRGRSSGFGMVMGINVLYGQIVTPDTKNFIAGSDANIVSGNFGTTNGMAVTTINKNHGSSVLFNLNVAINGDVFNGALFGAVGGDGFALTAP